MSVVAMQFAAVPVLLADWFTTTIWIVVISIGIINQLLGGDKKKQAQKRPPPPKPAGGEQPQGAKGLLDEVEKFLQEARKATEQAQNRPTQQPQRPQPRRAPQQDREQQKRAAAQRKLQQQRDAAARKAAQDAKARQAGALADRQFHSRLERSSEEETFQGTVAEHVQQHLDTSRFAERAGKLSHLQQKVEQDISGHVRSVFDHQVGTLASSASTTDASEANMPAEQIAMLLRNPASMRNIFVLQEVLRPPVERW